MLIFSSPVSHFHHFPFLRSSFLVLPVSIARCGLCGCVRCYAPKIGRCVGWTTILQATPLFGWQNLDWLAMIFQIAKRDTCRGICYFVFHADAERLRKNRSHAGYKPTFLPTIQFPCCITSRKGLKLSTQ